MSRSRYDIANSAIRIFLQDVGKFYDEARGFIPFGPKVQQVAELLSFFNSQCCYCGTKIDKASVSLDHLIPMNKTALGLHAWGNVVPCCHACNNEKQQKSWQNYLNQKLSPGECQTRMALIESFVSMKRYDPTLNLHEYAGNLYEDVGAVAMTLIQLRYKQAETGIQQLLKSPTIQQI
jgi:hypothetical protein